MTQESKIASINGGLVNKYGHHGADHVVVTGYDRVLHDGVFSKTALSGPSPHINVTCWVYTIWRQCFVCVCVCVCVCVILPVQVCLAMLHITVKLER